MGRTAARASTARRAPAAAPRHARRVSGPIRPGHPRPVKAIPPQVRVPVTAPAGVPGTGAIQRLRALPDHRFLDTLLRSRAWIWLMGIALGGIVAMQVSLLKMNAGIGADVQRSSQLEHANAVLEEQVAELSSGERISDAASRLGLVVPDAGSVGYLAARPGLDAARAARTMTAPSETARQRLAATGTTAATTATSATAVPTTVTPAATATPAATPAATTTTATAPTTATTTTATAPATTTTATTPGQ